MPGGSVIMLSKSWGHRPHDNPYNPPTLSLKHQQTQPSGLVWSEDPLAHLPYNSCTLIGLDPTPTHPKHTERRSLWVYDAYTYSTSTSTLKPHNFICFVEVHIQIHVYHFTPLSRLLYLPSTVYMNFFAADFSHHTTVTPPPTKKNKWKLVPEGPRTTHQCSQGCLHITRSLSTSVSDLETARVPWSGGGAEAKLTDWAIGLYFIPISCDFFKNRYFGLG